VDEALRTFPDFYLYAGFDCTNKWANFLGDVLRREAMAARLQEAFGVTEDEIQSCRERVTSKQWNFVDVAQALEDCLIGKNSGAPCSLTEYVCSHHAKACPEDDVGETNPVLLYLTTGLQPAWTQRPCWEGRPGHSAMKPRLRKQELWRKQPLPTLKWPCRMCEAEFPNAQTLDKHIDLLHGQYRFYSTWLGGTYSQCPYVVSPTEKRGCIEHFAAVQQHDTSVAEDEPYVEFQDQAWQQKQFWAYLYETCANEADATTTATCNTKSVEAKIWSSADPGAHEGPDVNGAVYQKVSEDRGFVACVFCAMLHWSDHLMCLHLVGPRCTMRNPAAVADLLSAEWYSEQWPLIPKAELEASAVVFPYQSGDGSWQTKKVSIFYFFFILHKESGSTPKRTHNTHTHTLNKKRITLDLGSRGLGILVSQDDQIS
jgi:hypothetical protein